MGAYFTVDATENIVNILNVPEIIGGLFITSTLSIVPEVFATWSVAKSGQTTTAATSVIADNTATMTLAFFPLALVSVPVTDLKFYTVNLAFVAILAAVYAFFVIWGRPKNTFSLQEVIALNGLYLIYLFTIVQIIIAQ